MSNTILFIGDVHVTPDELSDCERLMSFVRSVVAEKRPDYLLFAGDQYDAGGIVYLEVLEFWIRTLRSMTELRGVKEIFALVGNHDTTGLVNSTAHAMLPHTGDITVVSRPTDGVIPGVLLVPFMPDNDAFVKVCNESESNLVVCHQTFNGAKYDNGFYAKGGVEPDQVRQQVIAGHIHTETEFENVWYPGIARWRIISDANADRGLWLIEVSDEGAILSREKISTKGVCKEIRRVAYSPDSPPPPVEDLATENSTIHVDLRGPAAWVKEVSEQLRSPGLRIRGVSEHERSAVVKESEGVDESYHKYLKASSPPHGTPPEELCDLARERV